MLRRNITARGNGPVWFDFDNTPHVLFLEPFINLLAAAGVPTRATSRPQAQTVELAAERGISVEVVGGGDHRGQLRKVLGVLSRARALRRWISLHRPRLLVSCSRGGSLAARTSGVPAVGLLDYEHAEQRILAFGCQTIWMPDVLEGVDLPARTRALARFYPGLKENLYLDSWDKSQAECRQLLGLPTGATVVVARPPAESAHYASDLSSALWLGSVRALCERDGSHVLVVPRTADQGHRVRRVLGDRASVQILDEVVDGPTLVQAADLVVGGGGTMNREAAVLGVPVWSVFTGPSPAIDEQLAREGRLRWIRSHSELSDALQADPPRRRERRGPFRDGRDMIHRQISEVLIA